MSIEKYEVMLQKLNHPITEAKLMEWRAFFIKV